jgi:hypothetical protein
MIADRSKTSAMALLAVAFFLSGCGIAASYRPADRMTIRDVDGGSAYRKRVGVVALANTTIFTSDQIAVPFTESFLASMTAAGGDAIWVLPGDGDAPPFLSDPPRVAIGEMDVFTLSALARQTGMNAVVTPVLMDIRVRSRNTGFWFFKAVTHSLQIQTAAALYDAITGARLDLEILTDEVEIDEQDAQIIRNGREVPVDELIEMAEKMGQKLGARMGDAVDESKWYGSVVSVENGGSVISAGSAVGIAVADRFAVLGVSGVITGLDNQRFSVPGTKIGEFTITRVDDRSAFGMPVSGDPPPVGSIVVPMD